MPRIGLWEWIPVWLSLGIGLLGGCRPEQRVDPVVVANTRMGPMTIAVAPALNLSGAADFDPNRVADLMASELCYADGIKVIPVSRVLGILAAQGRESVESQAHALELGELLGADAVLVFAVTEYDPYDPPSVGISAQLYGSRPRSSVRALDPVAMSREAGLASSGSRTGPRGSFAQTQRVFDASHNSVVKEVREFASRRGGGGSPYGWRRYLVSQQDYMRFCCHATVRALLNGGDDVEFVGATPEK